MIVENRGSVLALLGWQWRKVAIFVATSSLTYYLVFHRGAGWLQLPIPPLAIVGAALGIFVSFRTNSAYDRWWEGRRLWGQLVNSSRVFASQVLTYLPGLQNDPQKRRLLLRHVAYIHWLRCALRDQDPAQDADLRRLLSPDEISGLRKESNPPHSLLHAQLVDLTGAADRGALQEMRLASLDRTLASLLDAQGGCERIKRTPMPRGYGFIADRLIIAFGCLLPVALVRELGLAVVPINILVCLSFALISEAGRVLEDPFTLFYNGLPLSSIATTIEINVRTRLGDTDLPAPVSAQRGILM